MNAGSASMTFASKMTGTGSAHPARRVTNSDLNKIPETRNAPLNTSDEWIRERTGIRERRLSEPGNPSEFNSSLAVRACQQALEMAGKSAEEIDAILFGTCTPDTLIPSTACWLQHKLGAKNAWALDLNAACSSWVFGLATADQFIQSGRVKTALVVGSETLSSFTNWEDRTSCILFGDGAGAVVLERTSANSSNRILSTHLHSDGTLWDLFQIPAGGANLEVTPERHARKMNKMQMKGREIFKVAVKTLADYAMEAIEANGLRREDIDWLIPHQANLRIIEAVAKRLDFPMSKVLVNLDRYGNTSSATVPTALDEAVRDGRVRRGHTILVDVFGAGLTYASAVFRW